MFRSLVALTTVLAACAFSPAGRARQSSMTMQLKDNAVGLVGTDIEFPEFDPFGFTKNASPEQLAWYRMAELKHGRVCMLAALGQIFQYFHHPVFPEQINGDKPFAALQTVFNERPQAAAQILLAIFAVEALGQFNQVRGGGRVCVRGFGGVWVVGGRKGWVGVLEGPFSLFFPLYLSLPLSSQISPSLFF